MLLRNTGLRLAVTFGITEIVVILLITLGPLKAAAAAQPEPRHLLLLVVISLAIMAFNLITLLSANRLLGRSAAALEAVSRVIGLLLAGLAIQLMIFGLTDLGLIPPQQRH
jgi:small neutral amino acid transporter SnatA (MarC family)